MLNFAMANTMDLDNFGSRKSKQHHINVGVPHSSILEPLFWNFINNLLHAITSELGIIAVDITFYSLYVGKSKRTDFRRCCSRIAKNKLSHSVLQYKTKFLALNYYKKTLQPLIAMALFPREFNIQTS